MTHPAQEAQDSWLVAGVGNLFLGDDGFGVEVVRRLAAYPLPEHVELADTGIRGVHLAYQLLDGYRNLVLVDTIGDDAPAGTLRVLHTTVEEAEEALPEGISMDGHGMSPHAVLALLRTLSVGTGGAVPERVIVIGCVPERLDEGIGLSTSVESVVDDAVHLVRDVVGAQHGVDGATHRNAARRAQQEI